MNPLFSVIIPVYGVEKYLDRCVQSVVNQTYKNLEIILVDDGSPDNCPKMCDEWSSRDARIRTVHRENGGLSCARNTGLSIASGDYITFIDSDDWIAPDTYEYCLSLLDRYIESDVVQFGLIHAYSNSQKVLDRKEKVIIVEDKEILNHYMTTTTKTGSYSVCRCLFKASIVKQYRFREGKINEDIDYKYKVLRDCKKMIVSNQVKYFYWQEGNSTSSGKLKARDFQLYEAAEELYQLTKNETYGNIAFLGRVKKARTPFSLLCRIAMWGIGDPALDEKEVTKKLVKEHRQNLPVLLKAPLPISRKALSILFAISYSWTKSMILFAKRFSNVV